MTEKDLLTGKKILIVDDEPDILDTLKDLLTMCDVTQASSFEQAKELLIGQDFDVAILDIMGVDGYELLDICTERAVIAVMLTAHALSAENIIKSYNEGAASFVPKDQMANITAFLHDILEAKKGGKHFWWRWLDRITESYLEKKFGPDWKNKDRAFWEKLKSDRL